MGPGFRRDDNGYFAHPSLYPDFSHTLLRGVTKTTVIR
jgi:hypothetical protein